MFDYYETLVELTESARGRFFDDLARSVGVRLPPGEPYRHWLVHTDRKLRLGGRQRLPLEGPTPPFRSFRETWLERFRTLFGQWGVDVWGDVGVDAYVDWHAGAAVYADVPPALAALRDRYRLGVLSDADRDFLDANVHRNGLCFDAIVASEDMRAYKPHVSTYLAVCARLRVKPEETVHVGDRPWDDIEGARHAGMTAIWINRSGASWPEDLDPPSAVVASLDELVDLLRGGRGSVRIQ